MSPDTEAKPLRNPDTGIEFKLCPTELEVWRLCWRLRWVAVAFDREERQLQRSPLEVEASFDLRALMSVGDVIEVFIFFERETCCSDFPA